MDTYVIPQHMNIVVNLLVSFSMELGIFIFQREILEILHRGCKLVQFAAQPNDQYRSRTNLWTRPCQPCQRFNVKLNNSHLGESKRVYFGAKFNNPGLSFDNGTHPRLAASPQFAVRGRSWWIHGGSFNCWNKMTPLQD